MNMTPDAAQKWRKLTAANAPQNPQDPNARGRCIAIVMDGLVYSAPTVNGEIPERKLSNLEIFLITLRLMPWLQS